jgi:hypothetical protein
VLELQIYEVSVGVRRENVRHVPNQLKFRRQSLQSLQLDLRNIRQKVVRIPADRFEVLDDERKPMLATKNVDKPSRRIPNVLAVKDVEAVIEGGRGSVRALDGRDNAVDSIGFVTSSRVRSVWR